MNEEKQQESIDIKLWAHEAGRWKGACVKLRKEIDRLREELDSYKQLNSALQSMMDLIVEEVGEVTIYQEAMEEVMRDKRTRTIVIPNEEEKTFTLRPVSETKEENE
jgi:hypothetical protein